MATAPLIRRLGRVDYAATVEAMRAFTEARDEHTPDEIWLCEHAPVYTLGQAGLPQHVLNPGNIPIVHCDRGGQVTYHGPGQLVAYPIVKLADSGLLLRPFVRALEGAMADLAGTYGVTADRRDGYPGCWVDLGSPFPRKLGALGLRVEKGITYHGIALNITTDLADFSLIDPCGMTGLTVTSIARELGWTGDAARPSTASVADAAGRFAEAFRARLATAIADSVRATSPSPAATAA